MPETVYFSSVKLLDGTIAEVKDAVAREAIAGGVHFLGVTTTALADEQTISSVVIGGETKSLTNGDLLIYSKKEFVYASSDGKVHELGDLSSLGALAYKDTASATYTPAGSVSKPDIDVTVTPKTIAEIDSVGSVTAGTANVPTAVVVTAGTADIPTDVQVTNGVAASMTLPSWGATVTGEQLEFSWSQGAFTPNTPTAVAVTPGTAGVPTAVQVTPGTAGVPTAVTLPTTKNTSVADAVAAELHETPAFTGTQATITVS